MSQEEINALVKRVQHFEDQLTRQLSNLKKSPKARINQCYLDTKLLLAKELWSNYSSAVSDAIVQIDEASKAKVQLLQSDSFEKVEDSFIEIVQWIDQHTVKGDSSQTSPNGQSSSRSNDVVDVGKGVLKSLTLPTFNGSFESWPTFHDLFISLVHNDRKLSDVQKLQYLKSATTDEAERLLAPYAVTETNYEDAWKLMLRVYNNKRLLVDGQLSILFELSTVVRESAVELKHLIYSTDQVLKSLKNWDIDVTNWDYFIIHMTARKLPSVTRSLWEQEVAGQTELPMFEEFLAFIEKRYRALMAIEPPKVVDRFESETKESQNSAKISDSSQRNSKGSTLKVTGCVACQGDHDISRCSKFIAMSLVDRWNKVKRFAACFQCLKRGHKTTSCNVSAKCMYYSKKHHTLLHEPTSNSGGSGQKAASVKHTTVEAEKEKIFATVLVNAESNDNEVRTLRAILDPTSNSCFVTAKACRLLKSRLRVDQTPLTGLGGRELGSSLGSATFGISSIYSSDKICEVTALIVQSVSNKQPSRRLERQEEWESLKDLRLADPMFNVPGDVDLLLDVEVFSLIIRSGLIKTPNRPNVHETSLGWIVLGVANQVSNVKNIDSKSAKVFLTDTSLENQLKKFWEQEDRGSGRTLVDEEGTFCEKLFTETTQRREDGRFIVRLPMRDKESYPLGESRNRAYSRFTSLENKLRKESLLKEKYQSCLNEYFDLNQIEKCGPVNGSSYYIPHHAVVKAGKFRVVFDASCKTDSGLSLNDCMYAGPKLQTELWTVVNNWRKYRYAFQADIEKMYRQVEVSKEDANRQRILWRTSENETVREFQLNRLTFGVKASPFLAIRSLHCLADESKTEFPNAQNAIKNELYVDDLRSGGDTLEGAVQLRKEIDQVLSRGKFPLRKWVANDSRILEGIPLDHLDSRRECEISEKDGEFTVKSLGLLWDTVRDTFRFDIKEVQPRARLTKRTLLSRIAGLYDPMGWFSPVIVKAKILMQGLWRTDCDWDEVVSSSVEREWRTIESSLPTLGGIVIPRWISLTKAKSSYQVHSFCDASCKALAAVTYLRVISSDGSIHVHLLAAKSKVAPLRTVTLPKLELCGAVLAAELSSSVIESLNLVPEKTCFWSDSEVSLAWIRQPPQKWTVFVANRVASIQAITETSAWSYVKSEENPADCASRGLPPVELVNHELWWTGPPWLSKSECEWPKNQQQFATNVERREKTVLFTRRVDSFEFVERFSSLKKATRVLAWIMRWRIPKVLREPELSVGELKHSLALLIRVTQQSHLEEEISLLGTKGNKRKSLVKLKPFLDAHGVLRVGGRLRHSPLLYNEKHPAVLPRDSHLTRLIIRDSHASTMHGSIQETLSAVRRTHWVIGGRNTIQQALTSCVNCNRVKARLCTQMMADLPFTRIKAGGYTFAHTGVDYAGPMLCRASTLRKAQRLKCYIALFVCFSTKAVNLQLVTDKSTEGFMKAFARFTSSRGKPNVMYSDNEKAFVKANRIMQKETRELFKQIHEETKGILLNEGITWSFNPPESPHQGGLWESNIKSMKRHLFASVGNALLTYEELSTVLSKVEACLNSRPLCAMSEDPEDLEVLTPGHFLVGRPLMSIPESDCTGLKDHVLNRWRYLQILTQGFWKRWSQDYLGTLQTRTKWVHKGRQLQVNDLVLLKEDLISPLRWRRGRIIETMPSKDSKVRVVRVKTMSGILVRDVRKICLLLPDPSSSQGSSKSETR